MVRPPRPTLRLRGIAAGLAILALSTLAAAPAGARVAGGISFGWDTAQALEAMAPGARAQELAQMAAAGVSWVRIDAPDTTTFNALIRASVAAGMHVDLIVEDSQLTPAAMAATGRGLAAAYAPLGIHDYEILNEPNITQTDQPFVAPADYVRILQSTDAAILGADPRATVIFGSLAPAADDPGSSLEAYTYLSDALADLGSAPAPFAAVGVHPYSSPNLPEQSASWNPWDYIPMGASAAGCGGVGPADCLTSILAAHGDGSDPLWVTESGASTGSAGGQTAETQRFQAATVTQSFALADAAHDSGPAVFNFQWQDTSDFDYGLLTAGGAPKLAAQAFSDAVAGTATNPSLSPGGRLGGSAPQSLIDPDSGAALVMQGDGNLVLSSAEGQPLWSTGTNRNPGATASLTGSGALVVTASNGTRLWSSRATGAKSTLVLQNVTGAQLLIRSASGASAWNAGA